MLSVNESGYHQLPSNNSWNHKCDRVVYLSLAFLSGVVSFFYNKFLSASLFAGCGYMLYHHPSILLDIPSTVITLFTRTEEFLPLSLFPEHHLFEQHFPEIKQEVDAFLKHTHGGKDIILSRDVFSGVNAQIGRDVREQDGETFGWRLQALKAGGKMSPYVEHFPILSSLLQSNKISVCALSVLEPGVTIPIHVGYYKGIMRYMLPIRVPRDRDNVFLCVNGKKHVWEEGKSVLWDDTFPHKVYNLTSETRVVIVMDIVRPLARWLGALNRFVLKLVSQSSIIRKEVERTEKQIKFVEMAPSSPRER